MATCRGLSLMSGGLDSQLAIRVLQHAGADVEAVCFSTPFFDCSAARKAADALGVTLHVIDFLADEIALLKAPPHGFGGAMNPCIDCHATMIRRADELRAQKGYDFVATGEVMGQRPMSQNKQSLGIVARSSGAADRLIRPLSAKLLEPTLPEREGKLDREMLLDISGRSRDRQIALAAEFGLVEFPSPAGGCKLTEEGFGRKVRDLMEHEGLDCRKLVELSVVARRFRLPGGSSVVLGRDQTENGTLKGVLAEGALSDGWRTIGLSPSNVPGPTALLPNVMDAADFDLACALVCAYSRCDRLPGNVILRVMANGSVSLREIPRPYAREPFKSYQIS